MTPSLPDDAQARAAIVEIGQRMYQKNFVAANDGNISCKTADGAIWTTPAGVSKGFLKAEDLVKLDLEGNELARGSLPPTSEIKLHLAVYQNNPDAAGIVHAHPPVSTAFAIAGKGLEDAWYPEAVVALGVVPCVPYATPGSQAVPDSVIPYCRDYNAVLLGKHGPVAWGKSLIEAFYRLEAIEHYALILTYLGEGPTSQKRLSKDQVAQLIAIRDKLGITSGGIPKSENH